MNLRKNEKEDCTMRLYHMRRLSHCKSLEQFADIVNEANDDNVIECFVATGHELAGFYAFDAADDAGYGMEEDDFMAHLDCLSEAGAEFDYSLALKEAEKINNIISV